MKTTTTQTVPIISNITKCSQLDEANNDVGVNTELNSWQRHQYTKIYNALKDLEAYNVEISIPEFVFIGFQSSGKTSCVSQAAKLALGVMKCGSASRCPTRFKLISNPNVNDYLFSVNGQKCRNNADLTKKISDITKQYEQRGIFSKDIIEVHVESAQIPELTFVDLPGLIKGDNKEFEKVKEQLDILTAHFLCEQNENGAYKYIPILVREPVDKEHDTHFDLNYIDELIEKYGNKYQKRKEWKDDTLFIVNKFDKQINRSPASSLINYMKYCCEFGETVLTMTNPTDENTANMAQIELNEFVRNVESLENEKWSQVIKIFQKKNDTDLEKLIKLKKSKCGVGKMNEFLTRKMCEIVKKILPSIDQQLDLAETKKKSELNSLTIQISLSDPIKLKDEYIIFNNLFLQYLAEFYAGISILKIDNKYKKSWYKEVNDFHVISFKNCGYEWKYEILPSELERILTKAIQKKNKKKSINKLTPSEFILKSLKLPLMGCAAIDRIINAWKCQISCMPFPIYSDDDILNVYSSFDSTMQPRLWPSIKNVVLDAVSHLSDAARFLSEMLRYKLKENADIVFKYTLSDYFGNNQLSNDCIMRLLQRTLMDYKSEIDNIINEFIQIACVGPKNMAQILDETFCEETINIGRFIDKLLSVYVSQIEDQKAKIYPVNVNISRRNSVHKQNQIPHAQSAGWFNKQSVYLETPSNDDNEDEKNEEKQILITEKSVINKMNFTEKPDTEFYELVHQQLPNHPISFRSDVYDIDLIRNLSLVFWTNIKQMIIRDTIQKLSNRVMAHIKQKDSRIANAIQCGIGRQKLNYCIKQLVDITGIDSIKLEQIILKEATVQIPKSVNDLNTTELQQVYGIDRETLLKQKEEKIKQLQQFQKVKQKMLVKIYHIKNNQFDKIKYFHNNNNQDMDQKEERLVVNNDIIYIDQ